MQWQLCSLIKWMRNLTITGLGLHIILEITLHCQVECPQTPAVHCIFIPLIISSHLLTGLDHFLEFVEDLKNFRSVTVLIRQVCHKIRSSGVKYKNWSKVLRPEKLYQDCDSCLKTVYLKNDMRTRPSYQVHSYYVSWILLHGLWSFAWLDYQSSGSRRFCPGGSTWPIAPLWLLTW